MARVFSIPKARGYNFAVQETVAPRLPRGKQLKMYRGRETLGSHVDSRSLFARGHLTCVAEATVGKLSIGWRSESQTRRREHNSEDTSVAHEMCRARREWMIISPPFRRSPVSFRAALQQQLSASSSPEVVDVGTCGLGQSQPTQSQLTDSWRCHQDGERCFCSLSSITHPPDVASLARESAECKENLFHV